ncbi:MAG: hypothetical protein OEV35_06185 [Gallionellaceae bacterium]|nr:hypothetical protein [Gallionellaceae bacterium]
MLSPTLPGLFWLFLLLLFSGCSQTALLSKQDYQKSQKQFIQGNTDDAYLSFPRGAEQGNFITTVEKAYLNLIQGKPQIKQLQQQVEILEDRVRYHVSREAKTFFYLQTPDDYYASEHEIIWLHFLLSWSYSLQGKYENACVEARVASSLLSLPWSPAGHFDDPAMRLFLAGLWTMCGEWREAQVDFRAAWFMDNRLGWARELGDRETAPANLFLVLGGPGPEVEWTPELKLNPLRSNRQVNFRLRGKKSNLTLIDRNGFSISTNISPDAGKWYERHLERESELHEIILDSAFGGKATASGAIASSKIAAKTSLGLLVGIGGTAVGAVIANQGVRSNADDLVKYGLVTAAASISWGWKTITEGYKASISEFKQDIDPSIYYRYVRYLPEYLWLGWSDQPLSYPVELRTSSGARSYIQKPEVMGRTNVSITFVPDANISYGHNYRLGNNTILPLPYADYQHAIAGKETLN